MNAAPVKILLIEDNPGDARLIREMLAEVPSARFALTHVERLGEALQRIGEGRFDAILLDLGLPDSQGLETLARIGGQVLDIPVIVMTGLDDERVALEALRKRAQDYIVKGQADGDRLVRTLRYAIERGRAEAEVERRNRELSALYAIDRVIAQSFTLEALLSRSLEKTMDALEADAGGILLLEPDGETLTVRELRGSLTEGERQSIKLGEGVPGLAAAEKRPVVFDAASYPTPHPASGIARQGLRTLVGVPLLSGGEVMGALTVGMRRPRLFSPEEIDFLSSIGQQLGVGVKNARMFQEMADSREATLNMLEDLEETARRLQDELTERKRAEEERVRLSMAVAQAAESIVIADLDGTILYVNPAFERITGYSREEAIGQNPRILKSGRHDAAFYREMWGTIRQGKSWTGHFIDRRKDGTLFEEEAVISPVFDPAGKIVNYVAVKRDVTQEVSLEAQLRQAQKMEAVGTLAGGVAHDFNNLLTTIIGFAQLSLLDEGLSPQTRDYIEKIPEQGKRAAQLISQLLTFSRKAVVERQPMSLLPLIKETARMLQRTIPESILIHTRWSGEVWSVHADPTQMQQVLLNLCVNAGHAMPEGGGLTVSLENVTLDEAYCRQYIYAKPGNYVCLSVQDTGIGMTPEVQARIFEPFFTTKGVGEGTGLGLATVYGIVKTHEGHINVYSEVGKGSEFKVYIPAIEGVATSQKVVEEPPAGGKETILLVEDANEVREFGQKLLERLGYTVLTAGNGEEALQVYREHQDEIALVLTDMVMPRMGGETLYEALEQIDPGVKVLVMSGYSAKQEISDLKARGMKGFVQKPFDFNSLGRIVRQALDEQT